jgi:hypothetical protein
MSTRRESFVIFNIKGNITSYCLNSASLRFITKNDMEKEGYGKHLDRLGMKRFGYEVGRKK